MIQPYSRIAFVCFIKVVPECINFFFGKQVSDGIDPAFPDELPIGFSYFFPVQGIIFPAFRFVDIFRIWNDIEITNENGGKFHIYELLTAFLQPLDPCQFIVKLLTGYGLPFGT